MHCKQLKLTTEPQINIYDIPLTFLSTSMSSSVLPMSSADGTGAEFAAPIAVVVDDEGATSLYVSLDEMGI